jgi:hypothetical protein
MDSLLDIIHFEKSLKCFRHLFVYILNRTFMEANTLILEDKTTVPRVWDYTDKLAVLFVDICDFIGLPVNIPWGLQTPGEEGLFYAD